MAITVEELEIVVRAKISDALKGLEQVKTQMQETFTKAVAPVTNSLEKINIVTSKMASRNTQAYKALTKAQQEYEKILQRTLLSEKSRSQVTNSQAKRDAFSESAMRKSNEQLQKQEQIQLKNAEVAQKSADLIIQQYHDIEKAVARATAKMAIQGKAQPYQHPPIITKQSKTATQILAEAKPADKASDSGLNEQVKQMSFIDKMAQKYNEKLGFIKNALQKIGLCGGSVAKEFQKMSKPIEDVKSSVEKITPSLENAVNNTKKLDKQMRNTANQGISLFTKLGKVISRAFVFLTLYKGLRELFSFIAKGIEDAINAPEIENVFRVAFKGSADEAEKFAVALKKAYGISITSSKEMLGTFQNMITSMGISGKNAMNMSKGLTKLAYDISSLYNVDPQQASENLQSALAGQGRAVRKYGYVILDSTIKETAYRLGIAKTGEELTEQQKQYARYMTLMEQSKNAQGDMARTLGNVANQLRILKDNIKDAGRSIGDAFIPFIQAILPPLNALFTALTRIGTALARVSFAAFGMNYDSWKNQQKQIVGGTGDMSLAEDEYAESIDKASKAQKGFLNGFDKLNISKKKESSTSGASQGVDFDIPQVETPKGISPYEKMADNIIDKFNEIKRTLIDLGLKQVIDNFSNFFSDLQQQIEKYDFKTAIKDTLLNGFEMAMSAIKLAQEIVFPIAIALDIPGIVYEAIKTISTLFENLNKIIEAVTPAFSNFVNIGLVPIAEWIGSKIRDALQFFQEQLDKVGNWFKDNEQLFSEFGEALGKLTGAIWAVFEPLLDTAWDAFKGIISGVVDTVLKLAEIIIKSLTPALDKFADWINKNQKGITMFFDVILNLILQILAVKGIKAFFSVFEKGVGSLIKNMGSARNAVMKFTGAIMTLTEKGVTNALTGGFSKLGKSTGTAFKQMGTALATFGKAVWAFILSNPWLVAITAVLALETAIGVTLYNQHKKTVQAMEDANYAKAFDGIPVSVDAAKASMQNLVDKYTEMNDKTTEYKTTMQNLQSEYENTSTSIDTAFASLQTGSTNAGSTLQTLSDNLISLSSNLKTQVETDGKYYFDTWSGIFDRTSVLSGTRETELLNEMATANSNKVTQIQTHEDAIKALQEQLNSEEIARDSTKYAAIQKELEGHYAAMRAIADKEEELKKEVELQRQALLAKEILEGKKKVTKENYQELLGEIETAETTAKDAVVNKQAELQAELKVAHDARIEQLKTEGASQQTIAEETAKYYEMLGPLNADYAASIEEIASQAIANKEILGGAFEGTEAKAHEVRDAFKEITTELGTLEQYVMNAEATNRNGMTKGLVDIDKVNESKDKIVELKTKLDDLTKSNPSMFEKSWGDSFKFIANEAADAGKEIQDAIDASIKTTVDGATIEGGEYSKNLADGLKDGVKAKLTEIGGAIGGISETTLAKMANDFNMHSPSKVMEERGMWIDEGFVDGIEKNKDPIETAFSSIFDSMERKMSSFISKSSTLMSTWAKDVEKQLNNVSVKTQSFSTPNVANATNPKQIKGFSVPKLAKGGVLSSPRLIMGGEYAGAKSNPEIVTPQSLMYETSFKAQQAANLPLMQLMREFMQLVKDKDSVIEIDNYQLGRAIDRHNSSNDFLLGI